VRENAYVRSGFFILHQTQLLVQNLGVHAVALEHLQEFVVLQPLTSVAVATDAATDKKLRASFSIVIDINISAMEKVRDDVECTARHCSKGIYTVILRKV